MPQAKRIKPKSSIRSTTDKVKKVRVEGNFPWALMLVILVCGIGIGMLFNGSQSAEQGFGSGLRSLFAKSEFIDESDDAIEIAKLIETKSSEKEFDFYELLPDIERIMPDDLPESEPDRAKANVDYYMQAASFRAHADAEKLRARLALKGYKSVTQAREVEGKGTYFRVRLGPYEDKRKAKTAKNKLQRLGVKPFIYTVTKD